MMQGVWTRIRKPEGNGCSRDSVSTLVHSDEWINIGDERLSRLRRSSEDEKSATVER